MKGKKGGLSEAYATWADSISQCCSYLTSCYRGGPRRGKASPSFDLIREQPIRVQAPSTTTTRQRAAAATHPEKPPGRKSFANSVRDFSVRDLLHHSPLPPRPPTKDGRPRISSPTNFRHVHSHSHPHFSLDKEGGEGLGLAVGGSYAMVPSPRERPPSLLALPGLKNGLSPILPYFDRVVTPPPAAMLRDGEGFDLKRSRSSLSFHVPRRRAGLDSHPCTPQMGTPQKSSDAGPVIEDSPSPAPPQVPPKSEARARARAYTAPAEVETIKERIAEALIEKERLQDLIDDVVERQSVYLGSRPSTAHSMTTQILTNSEPMPAIPALPPMAPSFAERLTSPQPSPFTTSPAHTANFPLHPTTANQQTVFPDLIPSPLQLQPFQSHPPTPPRSRASNHSPQPAQHQHQLPLHPPLPLVLRPPLRKKKSFSRVSTWLFPEEKHGRGVSVDSVTNAPRPVQASDGFYQCMSPVETTASSSAAPRWGNGGRISVDTVATWETEDGTLPTNLSTGCNSPCVRLDRVGTFGEKVGRGKSVGVAF